MANQYFKVKNGLGVGPFTVDSDTGNVVTTGNAVLGTVYTDHIFYANGTPYATSAGGGGGNGYTGSQGYTGSAGTNGTTGFTGSAGTNGYTGSIGYTGSGGYDGFTGSAGYTGSIGAPGYTGSQGLSGVRGYTGSQGDTGFVGSTGSQGYTGSQGDQGYTGSRGYTGSLGPAGATGATGDQGYTGSQGDLGYTGSEGYTGSRGNTGYTGSAGTNGYDGSTGYTGSLGYTGSIGYTGSAGFGYTGSAGLGGTIAAFGSFQDTSPTQTISNVALSSTVAVGTTNYAYGMTLSGNAVTINTDGTYSLIYTLQFTNEDTQDNDVAVWLSVNGVDRPDSNTQFTIPSKHGITNGHMVGVCNYVYPLNANDVITLKWSTQSTLTYIQTIGAQTNPSRPVTPGVIFTFTQVTYTQAGYTGSVGFTGSAGYTGSAGNNGAIGYVGSQGYTGSEGYTGSRGDQGYTGSTGAGYTGSQGDTGYTGSLGYTGSAGDAGYTGSLGYTGSIGYTGSTGYVGSQGSVGFTGSQGYAGSQGSFTGTTTQSIITSNTTSSTSTTTGALQVAGGAGIQGNVFAGAFYSNSYFFANGSPLTTGATGGGGNSIVSVSLPVDSFTGNGVQTNFTLSVTPPSLNSTLINIDGVDQLKTSYTLSGNVVTLSEAPANGAKIEVTTFNYTASPYRSYVTRTYTGNGSTTGYTITDGLGVDSVLVAVAGAIKTPTVDYTISGSTLTFTSAPSNGAAIQIRELMQPAGYTGSIGYTGSTGYVGSKGDSAPDVISLFLLLGV